MLRTVSLSLDSDRDLEFIEGSNRISQTKRDMFAFRPALHARLAESAKRASRDTLHGVHVFRLYQDEQTRILRVTMRPAMGLRGKPFNDGAEFLGELAGASVAAHGVFLQRTVQDVLHDGG